MGLNAALAACNIFALPVLLFVAQFERPPPVVLVLEIDCPAGVAGARFVVHGCGSAPRPGVGP
eukprot:5881710-Lingulodinium_polyedra.AAC.1